MIEIQANEIKIIAPWLTNQHYRTTPDYINWRAKVFERDSYTCQHCEIRGKVLNAHHIMSFADHKHLRYEVSNGLTLCKKCHKSEHERLRKAGDLWQESDG
jgi:5-methylcytosine-specific restriction endonuclease McrA